MPHEPTPLVSPVSAKYKYCTGLRTEQYALSTFYGTVPVVLDSPDAGITLLRIKRYWKPSSVLKGVRVNAASRSLVVGRLPFAVLNFLRGYWLASTNVEVKTSSAHRKV